MYKISQIRHKKDVLFQEHCYVNYKILITGLSEVLLHHIVNTSTNVSKLSNIHYLHTYMCQLVKRLLKLVKYITCKSKYTYISHTIKVFYIHKANTNMALL